MARREVDGTSYYTSGPNGQANREFSDYDGGGASSFSLLRSLLRQGADRQSLRRWVKKKKKAQQGP